MANGYGLKTVNGTMQVAHNLVVGGTVTARVVRGTSAYVGLFASSEELNNAYGSPIVGQWAMVQSSSNTTTTLSATVYRAVESDGDVVWTGTDIECSYDATLSEQILAYIESLNDIGSTDELDESLQELIADDVNMVNAINAIYTLASSLSTRVSTNTSGIETNATNIGELQNDLDTFSGIMGTYDEISEDIKDNIGSYNENLAGAINATYDLLNGNMSGVAYQGSSNAFEGDNTFSGNNTFSGEDTFNRIALPDTSSLSFDGETLADKLDGIGDGESAYEIAVRNGYEGTETEWLESLKGENGENGDNGNIVFPYITLDAATGELVITSSVDIDGQFSMDNETGELVIQIGDAIVNYESE